MRGESARGRDGGSRRIIVMCLGGSSSGVGTNDIIMRLGGSLSGVGINDTVRCPPEESAELEVQHCIPNRSEGGVEHCVEKRVRS